MLIDVRNAGPALTLSAVLLAGALFLPSSLPPRPVANVADVRRHAIHHGPARTRLPRASRSTGHTIVTMAMAVLGLALSVAGSRGRGALCRHGGGLHCRA